MFFLQVVTVLLDSFRPEVCNPSVTNTASSTSSSSSAGAKAALAGYEHVEFSTKSLILLMRYRAPHMKVRAGSSYRSDYLLVSCQEMQ